MPTFTYTARDEQGIPQTGNLEAVNEDQVVAMLQHRGLLVTRVSAANVAATVRQRKLQFRRQRARRMHKGIKTSDHVLLCQQLATLVEAGVPLLRSLDVIAAQVESRKLLMALDAIRHDVEAGGTLRDALAKHPDIFSKLYLNLVETGEMSGHLAKTLQQLARHFESAKHLEDETKTALTYPAVLLVFSMVVIAVFVYGVIPSFTNMFVVMNVELPLITKIVIGVSDFARQQVVFLAAGIAGTVFGVSAYLRTPAGRWMWDRAVLKVPIFKNLFAAIQVAEFAQGLTTLLESGVPLLSGLEILEDSATNQVYGRAIGQVKEAVKEGKTMAEPMEETGMFPPMMVQMVQVGEEVGELGKMVGRVARYNEEQVDVFVQRMTRLIEPLAILIMGGLVLIILLSIFMPIFKMAGSSGMS